MKLTMLGTGNALVVDCYNTCFVLEDHNDYFLVDGGGGNNLLQQLKKVNIDWMDIHHIFITHKHIDHLLGILWMVRLICQYMNQGKYQGEAYIYGHDEVIDILHTLSNTLLQPKEIAFINKRCHFIVIEDQDTKTIIGNDVRFFDIHSTKAKQFGFTMNYDQGKKLSCCGDEPYNEKNMNDVVNSDWLLHEAFCLYSQADIFKPYEKHHSTVKDACVLGTTLNIKNIVLYHTEDKNLEERKKLYTLEGESYFKGHIFIPDDLESIEL